MHIPHILFVVLEFAIILGIMVLVHEFGHFAVAKLCGVRVETFSIGFGKRIVGFTRGDTDYRISILPLGGYVKMAGEMGQQDGTPTAPDEFTSKPRWQRVLVALAGPFSNFLLSFFLLAMVAHNHHEVQQYRTGPAVVDYVPANSSGARAGLGIGDTIVSFNGKANPSWDEILQEAVLNLNRTVAMSFLHNGQVVQHDIQIAPMDVNDGVGPETLSETGLIPREQTVPLGILSVAAGTPADRAGIHAGDQIVSIDQLYPHSLDTMHYYLRDRGGAPSTLGILRNSQTLSLTIVPQHIDGAPSFAQWQIGFQPVPTPVDVQRLPFGASITQSLKDCRDDSKLILQVLQGMFTRHVSVKMLSGPVGIAQQIDLATQVGTWTLLVLVAAISLNLGIFNLLPFPPLDGGMILFLLIESVIRRDVNQEVKERIYQVAFVCVVFLAVFVLFNDITRLHLGHH